MKQIIKTSKGITKQQEYNLVLGNNIRKMLDSKDIKRKVVAWAVYEDTDDSGEIKTVLSVQYDDGVVYGTISGTFYNSFFDIIDFLGQDTGFNIIISTGKSKSNREFIYAEWIEE